MSSNRLSGTIPPSIFNLSSIIQFDVGNNQIQGSVVLVEVLATRRAVQFIMELGITQIIFEGDSEIVYKALKAGDLGQSSIGQFVKDIMSIVGSL